MFRWKVVLKRLWDENERAIDKSPKSSLGYFTWTFETASSLKTHLLDCITSPGVSLLVSSPCGSHTPSTHTSLLPQSVCLVAGVRRGQRGIPGPGSGCTVPVVSDRCGGWSRSPSRTAPGGTDAGRGQRGRPGAVTGTVPGCERRPGRGPPGGERERSMYLFLL